MNRKETNSFVKASISPLLIKEGYKYQNWAEQFHLTKEEFTYKIGWRCVERWKSCEIGFYIAIRSEMVSKIYNLFSGAKPEYHRKLSNFTLPSSYFTGGDRYNYIDITVSDSTKEKDVAKVFLPIYEKRIRSFFDEYSSLEKISSFMIHAIDNDEMYGDPFSYYMTSIIILKLINSPFFSERTKLYQDILKDFVDWQQKSYNNLVDYLKSI
jgi:hypothetical protein